MTEPRQPSVHQDGGLPSGLTGRSVTPTGSGEAAGYAVLAALAIAVLGTALHGQIWYLPAFGMEALPLVWGAVAALLLAGSLMVTLGIYTQKLWVPAVTGVLSYALVGLAATKIWGNRGIVPFELVGVMPGPAIAGGVWMLGLIAATLAAVLIVRRTNGTPGRG